MIRLATAAVALAMVVLPNAAAAQPRSSVVPVLRMAAGAPIALAGDRLLVVDQAIRRFRVVSTPVEGGRPATVFSVPTVAGLFRFSYDLGASAERAAFTMYGMPPAGASRASTSRRTGARCCTCPTRTSSS